MTTVLDTCAIAPPPSSAAELTVPLCFFDFFWLHFHSIRRLIFFNHPCSESEFLETIVPNLKHSLSLTLSHYLAAAGNLLYPLDTDKSKPLIRYVTGDSVPLTIAVSGRDFDELTGSHAKDSDQFYEFMPPLPPQTEEGDYKIVPLTALQATLFPGSGICIGLNNHHCLGDARSVVGFMWAWAEINRRGGGGGEVLLSNGESPPLYDRSVFGDHSRADEKLWNFFKKIPLAPSTFPLPTNRFRAAFNLSQSDIKMLKNLVLSKYPDLAHVSSFVVTTAYTWSCMIKSADTTVDDNQTEVFRFPADGRGRPNALVDPPVPVNFFGNCLVGGLVSLKHKEVAAEDGFLTAAEAISDQIMNQVNNKERFFKGIEDWESDISKFTGRSKMGVSGSPKFDLSNSDFGWGKAMRLEVLSMDGEKYSMSLCNSRVSDGGLVVGTSLPRERMEAFADIFEDGLKTMRAA